MAAQEEALAVTGQMGAQAAAQWVLDRPKSSTQWSIVKQGSSGSVLCCRGSPAVYNQPALQVEQLPQNPKETGFCMEESFCVSLHIRHCLLLAAVAAAFTC